MAEQQILTVIDCESILEHVPPGQIGSEAQLGSFKTSDQYVFMIGSGDYLASNQGKSELNISANAGDVIQWTVTDATSGQEYNAVLYGFTTGNGAITPPQMIKETLNVYQPQSVTAPTGPFGPVSYPDYVWQATLTSPGTQVQYSWKFAILDNDGKFKGAYAWDPFITIQ
jgi:hypothetical protein